MYNESVEEELKLLVRAVQSTRARFVAVQYNHYDLVRKAKQELKNAYPTRKTHTFSLEKATPESFVSSIIDCKEGIIFLEKFELLFSEEFQSLAIGFNQRRDLFSAHPLQIILFISEGNDNLKQFQKTLPDVFSITNPFVELRQEIEVSTTESIIELNSNFANVEEAKKEIERIEKRLKSLESTTENERLRVLLIIHLAKAYSFLGLYNRSKQLLNELLVEFEGKGVQTEENDIAYVKNDLALTLRELGELQEAKFLFQNVLEIAKRNYGLMHPLVAIGYSNLATVLSDLGDFEAAKELLQKAIEIDNRNYKNDHPNLAIRYANLATISQKLGNFRSAKELLIKAIESNEKNYGINHPTTALNYSNLAVILQNLGEFQMAKQLLRKAYSVALNNLGKEHPISNIIRKNLESYS